MTAVILQTSCTLKPANEGRLNDLTGTPTSNIQSTTPSPTASPSAAPTASPVPVLILIPNGTVGHGYVYASCQTFASISSLAPLPLTGGGGEIEFFGPDYPDLASVDSTLCIHECNEAGGSDTQIVEFAFDISPSTAALYSLFTITWVGQEGYHHTSCNGSPPTFTFGLPMQIFDGTNWVDFLQSPLNSYSTVTEQFNIPSNYLVLGKIWVRLYSRASAGGCATIQTDSISITLTP